MSLTEKRYDAAHTLAVSYNATPDTVNAAYERRVMQRMGLQGMDINTDVRAFENLYDARVRMQKSERKQWLAQLRLMATSRVDKMTAVLLLALKNVYGNTESVLSQVLVNDLMVDIPKMQRKYNLFRGLVAYELGGLGGMMLYDHIQTQHNPIVPLVVYGSMLVGGFAIGMLQDSIQRDALKIATWLKVLSFDKALQQEK